MVLSTFELSSAAHFRGKPLEKIFIFDRLLSVLTLENGRFVVVF